jgi:phosphate transport system permease protein
MSAPATRVNDVLPDNSAPAAVRRRRVRHIKDIVAKHGIGVGGVSVIIAVVLIFFYLLYVVIPMFVPATIEEMNAYEVPGDSQAKTLLLASEEQAEMGARVQDDGSVTFFDIATGEIRARFALPVPAGVSVTSHAPGSPGSEFFAVGLSDGTVVVAQHTYRLSYPNNRRVITPGVAYPLGESPLVLDPAGSPITTLALTNIGSGGPALAAGTASGKLLFAQAEVTESLIGGVSVDVSTRELPALAAEVTHLAVTANQRWVFAVDATGRLSLIATEGPDGPARIHTETIVEAGETITAARMLLGDVSLLVGTSRGRVSQWFTVRDEEEKFRLGKIREFEIGDAPVVGILPEDRRKVFGVIDQAGHLGLYHTTSERRALRTKVSDTEPLSIAIAPRGNRMLLKDVEGRMHVWDVHNKHPDISFGALWGSVWYEGYNEPRFIWQSTGGSQDFESKYSFVPLTFGTLKAAFYAMLIAVPLAIMGAIYTAYFMRPEMRQLVKPTIEIMEALPTVILGFLAGLWLAPTIEKHLPGTFALLLLMPIGIILFAYLWHRLPKQWKSRVPDGWEAALIIPTVILVGWFSFAISDQLEAVLFAGDMRRWLTDDLGIGYDQRNALIVGLAMGFAVIPTIFSITEDAIFGVPKHLSFGSLALGATPWQSLVRVVLPSASPGIFSAVMIGFGRAVGETMIVLMATGNTPVLTANIFEGMRTLSANIAVEMPESAVGSTHFRLLFLSGLVLFLFTFMLNTVAELVRQRLRKKYASL